MFDDYLDNSTKDKIVIAMKKGEEKPLKHATFDVKRVQENTLVDFIFQMIFLDYAVAQWKHQPCFSTAKRFIIKVVITSDNVVCAVALVQDFSDRLTKEEEQ